MTPRSMRHGPKTTTLNAAAAVSVTASPRNPRASVRPRHEVDEAPSRHSATIANPTSTAKATPGKSADSGRQPTCSHPHNAVSGGAHSSPVRSALNTCASPAERSKPCRACTLT